jgi:chromate transporter
MNLLILYAEFFQIGIFSVGGGLATLPFLYRMADKYDWLSAEMIGNIQAVAQSLPGAIGVNMAAYTGLLCGGILGAFTAALGLISPAIIIIIVIARILQHFKENRIVKAVFCGLRPAAGGLLLAAGFVSIRMSLYNPGFSRWYEALRPRQTLLFAALFLLIYRFKKHPVIYIAAAGLAGVILGL